MKLWSWRIWITALGETSAGMRVVMLLFQVDMVAATIIYGREEVRWFMYSIKDVSTILPQYCISWNMILAKRGLVSSLSLLLVLRSFDFQPLARGFLGLQAY